MSVASDERLRYEEKLLSGDSSPHKPGVLQGGVIFPPGPPPRQPRGSLRKPKNVQARWSLRASTQVSLVQKRRL